MMVYNILSIEWWIMMEIKHRLKNHKRILKQGGTFTKKKWAILEIKLLV